MKDFLKKESQSWVDQNIITQEQLHAIQKLYPEPKTNALMVIFAIIGSFLIGAGIILIFASNWWSIPLFIRGVLSFIPLLLAQGIGIYCFQKQQLSTALREGVGVFLMLSVFANMALIGQIFHTSSDLYSYIQVCLLLSLPSIYIFDSFAVFFTYMAGTATITLFALDMAYFPWEIVPYLILFLAILPFILTNLKTEESKRKVRWILRLTAFVTVSLLSFLLSQLNEINLYASLTIVPIILVALNGFYNYWKKSNETTAFKNLAVTILSFVLIMSVLEPSLVIEGEINILVFLPPLLIYLLPKLLTKQLFVPTDAIIIAVLLLALFQWAPLPYMVAVSVVVFLLGIYFIYVGSKQLTFRHLNYGLFLTFGVILVRFFSSDLSILIRGIVFLLLGTAFLIINLKLSQKRKELEE